MAAKKLVEELPPTHFTKGDFMICLHPSGMKVYMRLDQPGVYTDVKGNVLPEVVAKAAGFDTARMSKLGKVASDRAAVAEAMAAAMSGEEVEVVIKGEAYSLLTIGAGLFHIENADGDRLTEKPMGELAARSLYEQLTGEGEPDKGAQEVLNFEAGTFAKKGK